MEKIKVTQLQRDNLLQALHVMWPSVPPDNVVRCLAVFRRGEKKDAKPDCGTVACFGGWCAWWPAFMDQGVVAGAEGMPEILGRHPPLYGSEVSWVLFGDDRLFKARNQFDVDRGFRGTDHELVTHRLNWLLENSEVVA